MVWLKESRYNIQHQAITQMVWLKESRYNIQHQAITQMVWLKESRYNIQHQAINGMAQIESIQHTTPRYKSILALLIRRTTQFNRLLQKPTAMRNPKPHGILRQSLYLR